MMDKGIYKEFEVLFYCPFGRVGGAMGLIFVLVVFLSGGWI